LAVNQARAPFVATGLPQTASRRDTLALVGLTPDEIGVAESVVRAEADGGPLLALYVHAKDQRKQWSLANFILVGKALQREFGARFVLVGGAEDIPAASEVSQGLGHPVSSIVAGRLSPRTTLALCGLCSGFVGNDGAPMHLAALAGIPTLGVFCNWEVPGLWEPIAAPRSISVRPAWASRAQMYGISTIPASVVIDAALRLFRTPSLQRDGLAHEILTVSESGQAVAPLSSVSVAGLFGP
jgi:ADP-heptose:LPS heptosyltransferase